MESDDAHALFGVLDWRTRIALESISRDRQAAAQLIRADYPGAERAARLRDLGDAGRLGDAADLFSTRCLRSCRAALGAALGAPLSLAQHGDDIEVRTARHARLCMHQSPRGEWGLCWNTAALIDESVRAARELAQISRNAAVYRQRRALAAAFRAGLPAL